MTQVCTIVENIKLGEWRQSGESWPSAWLEEYNMIWRGDLMGIIGAG